MTLGAEQRRGVFRIGDRVQLTDPKGRLHTITLVAGQAFHTSRGAISHDDLIGKPEGIVVTAAAGMQYLALRPLLVDFVLSMPRGATVVYPKDSAQIVALADVYPGSRVLEAGAGSGALTCSLLRATGETGHVYSYERRPEFAEIAAANVERYFGQSHPGWHLEVGDLAEVSSPPEVDRAVLDMLSPWECIPVVAAALLPGGVLTGYVATTTQLSRLAESLRADGRWTEPAAQEVIVRTWHLEGLAVRPDHRMIGHTGFLLTVRRLADGTVLPAKRTRPSKGSYGDEYSGPRPGERLGLDTTESSVPG